MTVNAWQYIPFTKAAKVISDEGKRVKQRDYLPTGKVPVIDQGQEFIGGYVNDENMSFKGDLPVIIFGDHTRNIKFVNRPFAVGAEGVKILKPDPSCEPKFFYYFLHTLDIPSRGYSRHFQFLRNFDVPLAPLDQQKLIVAEIEKQFSRLDEALAALKRIQANLKRYKASVLKAAVEGRLTEEWRSRKGERPFAPTKDETGADLLKRILTERRKKWEEDYVNKYVGAHGHAPKDDSWKKKYKEPVSPNTTNLPKLPSGWMWATPEMLAQHQETSICAGPFGTIFKAKDFRKEGVPIIFLRHVAPGKYLTYKPGFMDASKWKELFQPYSVYGGELLIAKLGEPPGACAIYPDNIGPAMVTPDVMKMSINQDIAHSKYLMYYFNSRIAMKASSELAFGTTRLRLTLPIFRHLPIPLPPIAEQYVIVAEIESRLSVTEETDIALEINRKRSERLRQSILKKAFSGDLI